jgi:hydroxyethylthiazole kinase
LMARITGSGCTCTAAVAAFCAVERDFPVAAASALACLGAAAQLAAERSDGPGSFQVNWLDELHRLTPETLSGMARIEWKDAARRRERL